MSIIACRLSDVSGRRLWGLFGSRFGEPEIAPAGLPVPVGRILHPSPANSGANRNWEEKVLCQLRDQGVEL